jgi:hypothetical protein
MIPSNASGAGDALWARLLQQQSNEYVHVMEDRHSGIGVTIARWWILLQYSLLTFNQVLLRHCYLQCPTSHGFTQGWFWDILGPIFTNYVATYNFSQDTVQVCSCDRASNPFQTPPCLNSS